MGRIHCCCIIALQLPGVAMQLLHATFVLKCLHKLNQMLFFASFLLCFFFFHGENIVSVNWNSKENVRCDTIIKVVPSSGVQCWIVMCRMGITISVISVTGSLQGWYPNTLSRIISYLVNNHRFLFELHNPCIELCMWFTATVYKCIWIKCDRSLRNTATYTVGYTFVSELSICLLMGRHGRWIGRMFLQAILSVNVSWIWVAPDLIPPALHLSSSSAGLQIKDSKNTWQINHHNNWVIRYNASCLVVAHARESNHIAVLTWLMVYLWHTLQFWVLQT